VLQPPDHSGKTLAGQYDVIQALARSGFSVVYEARDRQTGGRVALKVLLPTAQDRGWARDQFAREVAALRSIEHPGVVPVLDSWVTAAGEPCLVMAFLDGPTLRAALRGGPLLVERAARIVGQLGRALSEVHARGIVHRDLKPENLILLWAGADEEQPVLIDFGTAAFRAGPGNELARTTLLAGSFQYLPPERLTGYYSPASDTYSFAVMILEMLTGKPLADLRTLFSETDFLDKIRSALGERLTPESASRIADLLHPAYDPVPKRRPAEIGAWAAEIADVLRSVGSPSWPAIQRSP
jgi:serine/threonine-protein kinase